MTARFADDGGEISLTGANHVGRPSLFLLILLAVVGSWMFFNEVPLNRMSLGTLESAPSEVVQLASQTRRASSQGRVRIATFNLDGYDSTKAEHRDIVVAIAHVLAHFEVIALQGIESTEHHLLPALVDELNRLREGEYDFVVGPRVGRSDMKQQFGFVFDRSEVVIDQYATYSVNDPDDLLNFEPFVACFRTRGVAAEKAFTFSVVNLHTYRPEVTRESNLLPTIFASVRNDGRHEDDVIVVGDFQASAAQLRQLGLLPGMAFVVGDANPVGGGFDNIMMDSAATTEFTGRSGIFDIVRELNVEPTFARRISRHFPVWAEFSDREGGAPGHVATRFGDGKPR